MRGLVAAALFALAACSQAGDAAEPAPRATTVSGEGTERPNFPVPEDIVGEYRVAGIDDEAPGVPYGIAVSITEAEISYEPKCAGFVWTYEYAADGTLTTKRDPDYGGEVGPDGSVAVCAVGLKPTDIPLSQAIDAAQRAGRTPTNAIELSGGGRSVTLYSQ